MNEAPASAPRGRTPAVAACSAKSPSAPGGGQARVEARAPASGLSRGSRRRRRIQPRKKANFASWDREKGARTSRLHYIKGGARAKLQPRQRREARAWASLAQPAQFPRGSRRRISLPGDLLSAEPIGAGSRRKTERVRLWSGELAQRRADKLRVGASGANVRTRGSLLFWREGRADAGWSVRIGKDKTVGKK